MHFTINRAHPIGQWGSGLWYWRLHAQNGQTLAVCPKGYKTRSACRRAMKNVHHRLWSKSSIPVLDHGEKYYSRAHGQ